MKKTKIVIYVDGGVVQSIYSNSKTVEVDVVDFDNLEAEGLTDKQRGNALKKAIKGMKEIA